MPGRRLLPFAAIAQRIQQTRNTGAYMFNPESGLTRWIGGTGTSIDKWVKRGWQFTIGVRHVRDGYTGPYLIPHPKLGSWIRLLPEWLTSTNFELTTYDYSEDGQEIFNEYGARAISTFDNVYAVIARIAFLSAGYATRVYFPGGEIRRRGAYTFVIERHGLSGTKVKDVLKFRWVGGVDQIRAQLRRQEESKRINEQQIKQSEAFVAKAKTDITKLTQAIKEAQTTSGGKALYERIMKIPGVMQIRESGKHMYVDFWPAVCRGVGDGKAYKLDVVGLPLTAHFAAGEPTIIDSGPLPNGGNFPHDRCFGDFKHGIAAAYNSGDIVTALIMFAEWRRAYGSDHRPPTDPKTVAKNFVNWVSKTYRKRMIMLDIDGVLIPTDLKMWIPQALSFPKILRTCFLFGWRGTVIAPVDGINTWEELATRIATTPHTGITLTPTESANLANLITGSATPKRWTTAMITEARSLRYNTWRLIELYAETNDAHQFYHQHDLSHEHGDVRTGHTYYQSFWHDLMHVWGIPQISKRLLAEIKKHGYKLPDDTEPRVPLAINEAENAVFHDNNTPHRHPATPPVHLYGEWLQHTLWNVGLDGLTEPPHAEPERVVATAPIAATVNLDYQELERRLANTTTIDTNATFTRRAVPIRPTLTDVIVNNTREIF